MIKRLVIYCLLGFLALLGVGLAHAQTVTPDYYYSTSVNGTQAYMRDGVKLCELKVAPNPLTRTTGTNGSTSINCYTKLPGYANETSAGQSAFSRCPSGRPYWDSSLEMAYACVAVKPPPTEEPNPCSDKNEFIRRWDYPQGGLTPPPSHYNGCVITTIKMLVCRKDPAGMTYCMWLVKRTGEKYTGAPDTGGGGGSDKPDNPQEPPTNSPPIKPPPAPPGKNPCPEGTVQAGSDDHGTPICMGQGSNPRNPQPAPPKIETEKNESMPDGSTKNTKTTTTMNSDGSTTTNTQVTITRPDGSKESSGGTVTSTNSAGMAGKADTPENDKYDLCKQNPHLSICRESSVNGTCGQITCVGDAIQCATLRAAAAMQCEQQADKEALQASPSRALGDQILSGNDPMKGQIDTALKGTEVDLSKTALDQSGFVGGGSCFPDKTFMVVGKTVTVSFARVCQDIQPLRAAVMACAFIIAYLIVGRSVIQG